MEESEFDELLERYLAGRVTDQERTRIEAWLETRKTEGEPVDFFGEAEERVFRRITGHGYSTHNPMVPRRTLLRTLLRVAAAVAVVALVSYVSYRYYAPELPAGVVSEGGHDKLLLTDGSIVWVTPGSTFSFAVDGTGMRRATLEGEALFEVAHDPAHPFRIRCNGANIQVLGTSFHVTSTASRVQVDVLTGKVNLSHAGDTVGTQAVAHETLVYAQGAITRQATDTGPLASVIEGTSYEMDFRDASLAEVLARVGRKFDVDLSLEDAAAGQCRLTADFTDHSLASTLTMLTEVLDVTYRKTGRQIVISGPGCGRTSE